jgi:N utilization substance protein A
MTGWRVDIKSETEIADEAAYEQVDWAEGEWVVDEETGEQVWQPADGGAAMSVDEWSEAVDGESDGSGNPDGEVEESLETEMEPVEEPAEEPVEEPAEEVDQEDPETN